VSDPDLNHAEKSAFSNLDFCGSGYFPHRNRPEMADVVLPSKPAFAEKDGTFSNTERRVQRVSKGGGSAGRLAKDDWKITCEIATRMGYAMSYKDSETIFNELASVTPLYAGISYPRIEQRGSTGPVPTPNIPAHPYCTGQFTRGKGLFHAIEWILRLGIHR
jgi:predicted molibdopterin-dependent oxidoreductase YjgC